MNVIDFTQARSDRQKETAEHVATLHIFRAGDGSHWGRMVDYEPGEYAGVEAQSFAEMLEAIAWVARNQAADEGAEKQEIVFRVQAFWNGDVQVVDNDDVLWSAETLDWCHDQLNAAMGLLRQNAECAQ